MTVETVVSQSSSRFTLGENVMGVSQREVFPSLHFELMLSSRTKQSAGATLA